MVSRTLDDETASLGLIRIFRLTLVRIPQIPGRKTNIVFSSGLELTELVSQYQNVRLTPM